MNRPPPHCPPLIGSLLESLDDEDRNAEWSAIAMVIEFSDSELISATYGYTYGEKTLAVAPDPWEIESAVEAYLATCLQPGDPLPLKMLVQFDRAAGKSKITLEDADSSRWVVTPETIDTIREELRPRLA